MPIKRANGVYARLITNCEKYVSAASYEYQRKAFPHPVFVASLMVTLSPAQAEPISAASICSAINNHQIFVDESKVTKIFRLSSF